MNQEDLLCGLDENFIESDDLGAPMSNLYDNVQNNSNVKVCNENENQINEINEENEHVEGSGYSFSRQDADILLVMLRTDKNANRKGIWDNRHSCFLLSKCATVDAMKTLRDVDLKVFVI